MDNTELQPPDSNKKKKFRKRTHGNHFYVNCWCGFLHNDEDECLWSKWNGEKILRCHNQIVKGTKRCLFHTTIEVKI